MTIRWTHGWRGACLAFLLAMAGCAEGDGGWTTSETNWLSACTTRVECATPYRCLCGLCMLPCDSAAFCANEVDAREVLPPNDPSTLRCAVLGQPPLADACLLEVSTQPAVCLPSCEDASDCAGYGGGEFSCVDGVCINDRRPATPGFDVGSDVAVPVGDGNNSLEQAVEIDVVDASAEWFWLHDLEMPFLTGESSVLGRLDPVENPGGDFDRDYYRFTLDESTWVAITTVANPGRVTFIDTVVTLYDQAGRLLAVNNDCIAGRSSWEFYFDSELAVWLPPGSYVIEVADEADWGRRSYENQPGDYRLGVGRIGPGLDNVLIETEVGDDEASALEIPREIGIWLLLGTLAEADDVDVFRLPRTPRSVVVARRMPPGIDGHGGPPLRLWLTQEGSTDPVALIDGDRDELAAPVEPGSYLLWVARDGKATSALEHYVIKHERTSEDAVLEADDLANDTWAGAQPLAGASSFVTWLGEGDVDYWSFASLDEVNCRSRLDGSGVLGLSVDVWNARDRVLCEGVTEGTDGPAYLNGVGCRVNSPGSYYLRLSEEDQDPLVTGTFVRCWVEYE